MSDSSDDEDVGDVYFDAAIAQATRANEQAQPAKDSNSINLEDVKPNTKPKDVTVTFDNCSVYDISGENFNCLRNEILKLKSITTSNRFKRTIINFVKDKVKGEPKQIKWDGSTNFYCVPTKDQVKGALIPCTTNGEKLRIITNLAYICDQINDDVKQPNAYLFDNLQFYTLYQNTKSTRETQPQICGISLNYNLEHQWSKQVTLKEGLVKDKEYKYFNKYCGGVKLIDGENVTLVRRPNNNQYDYLGCKYLKLEQIYLEDGKLQEAECNVWSGHIHPKVQWNVRLFDSRDDLGATTNNANQCTQCFDVVYKESDEFDPTAENVWKQIKPFVSAEEFGACYIGKVQDATIQFFSNQSVTCCYREGTESSNIKLTLRYNKTIPVFCTGEIPLVSARRTTRKRKRLVPLLPLVPAANLLLPAAPPSIVCVKDNCLMSFSACG